MRCRAAVADDFRGNPLAELRFRLRVGENIEIAMGMDIHKAGYQQAACGVNDRLGFRMQVPVPPITLGHFGDLALCDGDIRAKPGLACAVIDHRIPDDQIKHTPDT